MLLNLACLASHASIPAFLPGTVACLSDDDFTMTRTPDLLRRVGRALRAGALVIRPPSGPTFDDIEREVEAETAALRAYLDAIEASLHPPARALAS